MVLSSLPIFHLSKNTGLHLCGNKIGRFSLKLDIISESLLPQPLRATGQCF